MATLGAVCRMLALAGSVACAATSVSADSLKPSTHAGSVFRDDFNADNASRWVPQGGTWTVIDGEYVGQGKGDGSAPCGSIGIAQSVIKWVRAANVEVEADMRSIERVDKWIILRSVNPENEIKVNFRAERPDSYPADLIVEQLHDCQNITFTPEFSVLIPPHQVGQTIHVHVILVGKRLRVLIDRVLVLDRTFPFPRVAGRVGLAAHDDEYGPGTTAFDNVKVRFGISDRDHDGVRDGRDRCHGTVLPERVPTVRLTAGRFANTNKDLAFETKPPPKGPGKPGLTLLDTAGCSCEQIIARGHLGSDHRKYGCSRRAIKAFIAGLHAR